MKIASKYEKGKVPAGLETFYTVEKDGFMFAEFEDDVALVTNPALATQNAKVIGEKKAVQEKYDSLVSSTAEISREVGELRTQIASGGQVSADELAIITALKGIKDKTPAEIKKLIEEAPALQAQIDSFKMSQENAAIAQAMGWKPDVFGDLRPILGKDLTFEVSDLTENGKTVKKVHVSGKDDKGVTFKKDLGEYTKETSAWTNYMPSLQAEQQNGPNWVAQSQAGGDTTPTNVLADRAKAHNDAIASKGNPLLGIAPAQPTPAPAAS